MKNIFKFAAISAAVLLGACSKDAPTIQAGSEGLKYVVSSNVLNSEKEAMELGYADSIVFVMSGALTQVSVTIEDTVNDVIVPIRVRQSGDSVIINPSAGAWASEFYVLNLVGSFGNGVGVSFELGLARKPGLNLIDANFYDIKNEIIYQEVPVSVGALTLKFDQVLDTAGVEQVKLYDANNVEVATTTAVDSSVLTVNIGVDALEFNTSYHLVYTVRSSAGFANGNTIFFRTATSTFLPVESNVKVLGTAVGEETYDFPLQGTLEVTFSEALDTAKSKIKWLSSTSSYNLVNRKGVVSAAGTTFDANVEISGSTLRVTPAMPLTGVSNGLTVGFKVVVQAARDIKLFDTLEVQANLRNNKLYVVSTNVIDSLGKYRPFKVTGDSLVVTFSKAVNPEGFKAVGLGFGYSVSWDATKTVATIKNIASDTLNAGDYDDETPYEYSNTTTTSTCKYGCGSSITFSAVAADDGQVYTAGVNGYALQIHTEFDLALVNANVVAGHVDPTRPVVVAEGYKVADSLNDSMDIVLTFNRAVDTTLIKKWTTNDPATTKFVYINDHYYTGSGNAWADKIIPATLSFDSTGKILTLNPVEKLAVFTDKNQTSATNKDQYTVVFNTNNSAAGLYGVRANGLKAADGVSSITLASGAAATSKYFTMPMVYMNVSGTEYTPALAMKDTTIAGTKYVQDSLSVGLATSAAKNGTSLKFRLTQPTIVKGVINNYQYRAQVRYKGVSTVSGWFYSANETAAQWLGMLDLLASDTAAKKTFTTSLDISGMAGLMTWDKDGSGSAFLNGQTFFNNGDTIELQVRGYHLNSSDTSYTPWSASLKYVDNVAPMNPVYQGQGLDVTVGASRGAYLNRTTGNYPTVDSVIYVVTFPEDMDVSTAPLYTFYPTTLTAAEKPVFDNVRSKWTDAQHYKMVFNLASGTDYSAVTSLVFAVNKMRDAAGNEIKQETGSPGSLVSGTVAPTRGTLNIGYALTNGTAPNKNLAAVSTPAWP
jgi:hypothetical protein